jgi:hypothetical protein
MATNKRLIVEIINGEDVIMTIDQNLLSAEFGALDRGNLTDVVDWGIYANRGSISFIDNSNFFNNENVNSFDLKKYTVRFYLAKNSRVLISTFKIDSVQFDEEKREVNIELVSGILSLEQKNISQRIYPFYPTNAKELLSSINKNSLAYKIIYVGEDSININKTFIGCPYIGVDTVWNVMNKLCQATMSRVIENPEGRLYITSSFPQKTPIIVKPYNVIKIEKAGFVKIENPSIDVTKRVVYDTGNAFEGASKSFSIERSEKDETVSGISGFTMTNKYREEPGNYTTKYRVDGSLELHTNYKIFQVNSESTKPTSSILIGPTAALALLATELMTDGSLIPVRPKTIPSAMEILVGLHNALKDTFLSIRSATPKV